MRIIQITTAPDAHGNSVIFGLEERGLVYRWNHTRGEWDEYWRTDTEERAPFLPHDANSPRNSSR